jgi:hypothetical protein
VIAVARASRGRGVRAVLVATVVTSVLMAGCLGGRRGAPGGAPAGPAGADTTRVATARADTAARDTTVRDTLAQDTTARDTTPRDTTPRDTTARAGADTVTRADTARRVEVPAARRRPPARECLLDFNDNPPESRLLTNLLPDGTRTTFIGGGMVAKCQGEPNFVRADSAEQYENVGMLILIGNVVFEQPGRMRVESPTASYFIEEEKLVATGGVTATDLPSGSTFTGPTIEYYRAGTRRDVARLFAPMRPRVRLIEKDSAGRERPPIDVVADQMEDVGDTLLLAWGHVIIDRESIHAEGDSSSFNKLTETSRLVRGASVTSRDTARPFRLVGDTIDLLSTDRQLERVVARHQAQATSRDVAMRAERVEMKLDSQQVSRAWAFGPGRSFTETLSQQLEADSIEIRMPGQVVREVRAIGAARALGTPDTLRIRNPERDILAGDTIVAEFDTLTTPPDTTAKSVLRQVVATGRASSRYQVPSSRGPDIPPAINYVRGLRITAAFEQGEMRTVLVDSQAVGLYLEPVLDSLVDSTRAAGRDSAGRDAARRDAAGRDTTRRDTTRRDSLGRDSARPPRVPPDTLAPANRARVAVARGDRTPPSLSHAHRPSPAVPSSRIGSRPARVRRRRGRPGGPVPPSRARVARPAPR